MHLTPSFEKNLIVWSQVLSMLVDSPLSENWNVSLHQSNQQPLAQSQDLR